MNAPKGKIMKNDVVKSIFQGIGFAVILWAGTILLFLAGA